MNLKYFHERLNEERANSKLSDDKRDPNVTAEEIAKKHDLETSDVASRITAGIAFELRTNEIEDKEEAKNLALTNLLRNPDFYEDGSADGEE